MPRANIFTFEQFASLEFALFGILFLEILLFLHLGLVFQKNFRAAVEFSYTTFMVMHIPSQFFPAFEFPMWKCFRIRCREHRGFESIGGSVFAFKWNLVFPSFGELAFF